MSYDPPNEFSYSASGELKTSQSLPIIQISATYGTRPQQTLVTVQGTDATAGVTDDKFKVESGTDPSGLASILSARIARYRAGQGLYARFSALFSAGVQGSYQIAGFVTSENGMGFGRINGQFGIIHYYGGIPESQILTLTAIDAGAQTVTVSGTDYPVTLTGVTAEENAYQIAEQLNPLIAAYDVSSNGVTVVFQGVLPEVAGAFAYTGTGTFAQVAIGKPVTTNFIPQSLWNRDPASWLVPSFGNIYSVQFQYLGFGNINFYVYDPETSKPLLVHVIEWANSTISANTSNPNLRIGWLARNVGGTTPVTVEGGSAAVFLEGIRKLDGYQVSVSHDQIGIDVNGYTNIIAVRNRSLFADRQNRIEAFPTFINLNVTATAKVGFFDILIDPVFSGFMEWNYVDEANSVIEYAVNGVEVTGGRSVGAVVLPPNQPATIVLNSSLGTDAAIAPNSTIAIVGRSTQNVGDFQASITLEQDD